MKERILKIIGYQGKLWFLLFVNPLLFMWIWNYWIVPYFGIGLRNDNYLIFLFLQAAWNYVSIHKKRYTPDSTVVIENIRWKSLVFGYTIFLLVAWFGGSH